MSTLLPRLPGSAPSSPARLTSLSLGGMCFLPPQPRLRGAGSPGKFRAAAPAAGSSEPRSLRGAPGLVAPLLEGVEEALFLS